MNLGVGVASPCSFRVSISSSSLNMSPCVRRSRSRGNDDKGELSSAHRDIAFRIVSNDTMWKLRAMACKQPRARKRLLGYAAKDGDRHDITIYGFAI